MYLTPFLICLILQYLTVAFFLNMYVQKPTPIKDTLPQSRKVLTNKKLYLYTGK